MSRDRDTGWDLPPGVTTAAIEQQATAGDIDPRVWALAQQLCDDRGPRSELDTEFLADEIQGAVDGWFAHNRGLDTDPDGETYRGDEAAAAHAESHDQIQREFKR